ncbi:branched-chain amino acid transport system II carrier protein [Bacillus sp. V3B]|uniref:branched-chain amino acid transport system II carrier protein n=1 Tax=Bacillus sp. V3B TaxID=2804915 RepID=UPI00210A8B76|nr:branched-chain amino acid transport system II carrier protein [Bacillus sp. V3B]MCQ6276753.1 branched-chain amino acid transport system II carrier protein [Bacillus sp. V3B]
MNKVMKDSLICGFVLTGIVRPLLGLIAVLNAKGKFEELTKPVSSWFHIAFNLAAMRLMKMDSQKESLDSFQMRLPARLAGVGIQTY